MQFQQLWLNLISYSSIWCSCNHVVPSGRLFQVDIEVRGRGGAMAGVDFSYELLEKASNIDRNWVGQQQLCLLGCRLVLGYLPTRRGWLSVKAHFASICPDKYVRKCIRNRPVHPPGASRLALIFYSCFSCDNPPMKCSNYSFNSQSSLQFNYLKTSCGCRQMENGNQRNAPKITN